MINSNKKQEFLDKWEPILTKLGIDSQHHVKLALYAEQHQSKIKKNDDLISTLELALTVLSRIKDLNKVMITDSLEGSIGVHKHTISIPRDVVYNRYDEALIVLLVNIFNEHIDNDKIICVQFLFESIMDINEKSLPAQILAQHNYLIC